MGLVFSLFPAFSDKGGGFGPPNAETRIVFDLLLKTMKNDESSSSRQNATQHQYFRYPESTPPTACTKIVFWV